MAGAELSEIPAVPAENTYLYVANLQDTCIDLYIYRYMYLEFSTRPGPLPIEVTVTDRQVWPR